MLEGLRRAPQAHGEVADSSSADWCYGILLACFSSKLERTCGVATLGHCWSVYFGTTELVLLFCLHCLNTWELKTLKFNKVTKRVVIMLELYQ